MADKLSDKISVIIAPLPPMAISSVPACLVRRAMARAAMTAKNRCHVWPTAATRRANNAAQLCPRCRRTRHRRSGSGGVACRTARFRATANHIEPGRFAGSTRRKMDFLRVYDHRRERSGYVRASQVRQRRCLPAKPRVAGGRRFVRDTPGTGRWVSHSSRPI